MSAHSGSRNPEHTVFGNLDFVAIQRIFWLHVQLRLLPFAVGNIPYGVTEEMLTEIFSEVGPVKYFR